MKKVYAALLILLAIVATAMGLLYFMKTAGNLPHFFPGYTASSTLKHTKHGLAFIALAIILVLGAWMVSGPKETSKPTTTGPTDPDAS
jgi:hypothetical protein